MFSDEQSQMSLVGTGLSNDDAVRGRDGMTGGARRGDRVSRSD